MEQYNLSSGLIITTDNEDSFEVNGKKITMTPAWKWLLQV
jgi:predicted AAA+ superfamily ATPase